MGALLTLSLISCESWNRYQRLNNAYALQAAGQDAQAILAFLPPPWDLLVGAGTLLGTHLAATLIKPGKAQQSLPPSGEGDTTNSLAAKTAQ